MEMTLRTIQLYGKLGEEFGKEHKVYARTIREALNLLAANFKTFRQHIVDKNNAVGYEVWDGNKDAATEQELTKQGNATIKIIPVLNGASANARIVAGAVLMVVGAYVGNENMVTLGASLVFGGIAEKLSPKVKTDRGDTNEVYKATSYIFSGATNQIQQGAAIAVGYGLMIVGSNVISAAITTANVPV